MESRQTPAAVSRRDFVRASASVIALPTLAAVTTVPPHKHGLNGALLPPNRPINLRVRVLDGPDFALETQRGSVVALNFFATWCPPCREEAHDVVAFATAHVADTTVVSINLRETDDRVRAWRKTYAVNYPIAMDERGILFTNLGLKGIPTTLFFRPDGSISCVYLGPLNADELEAERVLALEPVGSSATDPPKPQAT
jgi:thiol-disulfide isomerase/thioredoxin